MSYLDVVVIPVPTARKEDYLAHARMSAELFKDHGALSLTECWGDDIPEGQLTSLPMAVKLDPGETVVAGWIEWPDRATRDAGWAAIMADERMAAAGMPFDGKRMIFGGFDLLMRS